VVGEYERAFQGQQLDQLGPILRRHGVALWLPETYGPVDFDNPRQLALLDLLGVRSQREVSRARYRVIAAMRAQTELQGRHLGGRPPYGYRLVDAGPHPNRADARWGRHLHRLEPDPATAPHVRWIFAKRLTGRSVASITRDLNDNLVPCPSQADRSRNSHRFGAAWMLTTVAAILANPRYTGRQVWNRQRTDHDDLQPLDGLTRQHDTERWNLAAQWAISTEPAHPALISEIDFVAVQQIHTAPEPADGTIRTYALTGWCPTAKPLGIGSCPEMDTHRCPTHRPPVHDYSTALARHQKPPGKASPRRPNRSEPFRLCQVGAPSEPPDLSAGRPSVAMQMGEINCEGARCSRARQLASRCPASSTRRHGGGQPVMSWLGTCESAWVTWPEAHRYGPMRQHPGSLEWLRPRLVARPSAPRG
jgi:hypothetical protein